MSRKRKISRNAETALIAVVAMLTLGAMGSAQDFSKYHNYAEMTTMLQNLANANKNLVKLESIGKTLEKRDLWVLQIANPAGVPLAERPALLIAANFEGDHLIGSELACFIADYLVKNYASNANVKQRLDNGVVYIMPRLNPDGAEFMWAPVKSARRTNTKPFDDDNDGRTDEDGPEDLNKDGFITVMRVKDPNGDYMIDPEEPRLMKKADPKKGEKGEYALYLEAATVTATDSSERTRRVESTSIATLCMSIPITRLKPDAIWSAKSKRALSWNGWCPTATWPLS